MSRDAISIIGGSGALGFGLALRLGRAGVPVVIGSRDVARARQAAAQAQDLVPGGTFCGMDNAGAAGGGDIVLLSVPFRCQSETLTNLRTTLRPGQIVVDATVPLAAAVSGKATRTLAVWQGSAAQQAQEMVPDGVRVLSALHTVSAARLKDLDCDLDEDVLLCGDAEADKQRVAALIQLIPGLRCVDCGPLEMARLTEGLAPLLIGINRRHRTHAGVRITGLPDR